MSAAYYNEIDPYAAAWLRNLIAAGHISPGEVDERSIEDVHPADLTEFVQCHFFAGIGVWSLGLRRAGWTDDRPVWTGSCPCQPFSAAGKGAGFADERHLWPAFHHLIGERRPAVVLGEQVASKDADAWIDLVQDDLEGLGYRVGAVPFPSAGIGAPHIRDRLYWMANADSSVGGKGRTNLRGRADRGHAQPWPGSSCSSLSSGLAYAGSERLDGELARLRRPLEGGRNAADHTEVAWDREAGGLADAYGGNAGSERQQRGRKQRQQPQNSGLGVVARRREMPGATFDLDTGAGPTNGFWRDADWLGCRDGKWRPVEPGAFPLAHGAPARVGRLRAYGNAINAEAARVFIECVMECQP